MTAGAGRRAPRLGPGELLAPYFTRRGRFRRLDPRKGKALPSVARMLGSLGWALLLVESFRRARRVTRAG